MAKEDKKTKVYFEPPKKHWVLDKCSLNNFEPRLPLEENTLKFIKKINKNSPLGVYIHGGFGNGKSHLLVGIARKLKEKGLKVAYAEAERLGENFWRILTNDVWDYSLENPLTKSDILIIDDIDIKKDSTRHSELFYNLLLERASQGAPLIISSNHSPQNLVSKIKIKEDEEIFKSGFGDVKTKNVYGVDDEMQGRVLDRLNDMCLFIDFSKVPSRRKERQEEYQKKFLDI